MNSRLRPRIPRIDLRIKHAIADRELDARISDIESYVQGIESDTNDKPVLIFNASTRIHRLSLNAAYGLLAGWGLRLSGTPVHYVVCHKGMQQCILGTDPDDPSAEPPCESCIGRSSAFFPSELVLPLERDWSTFQSATREIAKLDLAGLRSWTFDGLALGSLCLPGLRWALRRHHLANDEPTRSVFRQYLASAASLAERFDALIEATEPRAVLLFNGIFYPEAVAREVAKRHGLPTITHEVGLRPYSAYFSHADATFRELELDQDSALTAKQELELDTYLADRRAGRFTMAGIRFWPDIEPLPSELLQAMASHDRVVSVFTNVIFDTSQIHANGTFPDMFAWLDSLRPAIERHPESLFVIRAHPDEDRPGKASRESVAQWFAASRLGERSNVVFYGPSEMIDSYELVSLSSAVLTYNSSIGLEASIMGRPVLTAGRSRFSGSQAPIASHHQRHYARALEELLAGSSEEAPEGAVDNARQFLHHELYRASLDLSEFLTPYPDAPGMVSLAKFSGERIGSSEAIEIIVRGILDERPFVNSLPVSRVSVP